MLLVPVMFCGHSNRELSSPKFKLQSRMINSISKEAVE